MVDLIKDGEIAAYADFDNRLTQAGGRPVARAPLKRLPIIDLSPFVAEGSRAERERLAGELRAACIDIGFFYLTGHGIPESELDEAIAWAHRFWALPLEERMKLHKRNNPAGLGYGPSGGETYADAAADTREIFSMSREALPGEPKLGIGPAGRSQWPDPGVLPGFEPFMKAQLVKRIALTRQLLHAFPLSLDLPETHFDEAHEFLGCNFVLNYYPAVDPVAVQRTQWGISPHSDYGTFTLLWQDDRGGLEVRNSAGEWIGAPPLPGAFVVNIGDLFARWTNDLYVSTLHRAVSVSGGARVSAPFFVYPQGSVEIRCLDTCQGPDNPPRYEPVRTEYYMRALLDQSHRTGRPGIAAQTATRFRVK